MTDVAASSFTSLWRGEVKGPTLKVIGKWSDAGSRRIGSSSFDRRPTKRRHHRYCRRLQDGSQRLLLGPHADANATFGHAGERHVQTSFSSPETS